MRRAGWESEAKLNKNLKNQLSQISQCQIQPPSSQTSLCLTDPVRNNHGGNGNDAKTRLEK